MKIGKKAAFLTAAAGALVLAGAGGASAHGLGHLFGGEGVEQENTCATAPGPLAVDTSPLPGIEYDTNCLNFDPNGSASEQSNTCTTAPGPVTLTGLLVPSGEIEYTTDCVNLVGDSGPHFHHH